jgi:hypothetical protein
MSPIGVSNKALWTGRVLSTIAILFLLMDAVVVLRCGADFSPRSNACSIRRNASRSREGARI